MKTTQIVGLITLLTSAVAAHAAVADPRLGEGSKLWLEGDSTLHRFKAETTQARATFELDQAAPAGDLEAMVRGGAVRSFTLTVPVAQLSSGESGLDENMRKALRAADHPDIVFRMDSYSVVPGATDGTFTLQLKGRLSISGTEKAVGVDVQAMRTASGLRLTGSKALVMSEYGVQPPSLMLGTIKVRDPVVIKFDLRLQTGG